MKQEINNKVRTDVGAFARLIGVIFMEKLPKTRSGKILRGTIRKISNADEWGMPATIEHSAPKDDSQVAKAAAECTQFFITAMDSLKVRRPVGTKVKVVCKDWSAVAPVRL